MLTLVDDFSRASWVRFLKKKSDTKRVVQAWIKHIENQTDAKVKRLRSDRGDEYVNIVLKEYFEAKGISHEKTNAYTPSQNGVGERLNITLFDKARSMIAHMEKCDKWIWGEAVNTANYLRNRSPTKAIIGYTPYECFTKTKPFVSHLRIFGCEAYVNKHPKQRKGKIGQRSWKGFMVGYAEDTKGWRILDESTGGVKVSKDVVFSESSVIGDRTLCHIPQIPEEFDQVSQSEGEGGNESSDGSDANNSPQFNSMSIPKDEKRYPVRIRKKVNFYVLGEPKASKSVEATRILQE